MSANPDAFSLDASYTESVGVYRVDQEQIIRFWNPTAERLLGHTGREVIGRPCYQVLCASPVEGLPPVCLRGCPFITLAAQGRIPPPMQTQLLCASGERKPVTLAPMVIPAEDGRMGLLHLFRERPKPEPNGKSANCVDGWLSALVPGSASETPVATTALTGREMEVLRLMAAGMTNSEIADLLTLSYHTVRNHVCSIRGKLQARNREQAARAARDLGLI